MEVASKAWKPIAIVMPILSSVFGGSRGTGTKLTPSTSKQSSATGDEHQNLRQSLLGVDFLLNDDVEGAERELQKGVSAYHTV